MYAVVTQSGTWLLAWHSGWSGFTRSSLTDLSIRPRFCIFPRFGILCSTRATRQVFTFRRSCRKLCSLHSGIILLSCRLFCSNHDVFKFQSCKDVSSTTVSQRMKHYPLCSASYQLESHADWLVWAVSTNTFMFLNYQRRCLSVSKKMLWHSHWNNFAPFRHSI